MTEPVNASREIPDGDAFRFGADYVLGEPFEYRLDESGGVTYRQRQPFGHRAGETLSTEITVQLPTADTTRGSGMPGWRMTSPAGTTVAVSPTEVYNRNDEDVPSVTIVGVHTGEWTLPDARRLALSILAAVRWVERDEADP